MIRNDSKQFLKIKYLVLTIFIFTGYFSRQYFVAWNYSFYFLFLSSMYWIAVSQCLAFLKAPIKSWHSYGLFVLLVCSGFLSQMSLVVFFQVLSLCIFVDMFKLEKSALSFLGLWCLALAIKSHQFFGLCQWDQIITLVEFGRSGLLSGDAYAALSLFLGIGVLALWLICLSRLLQAILKQFIKAPETLANTFVLVIACAVIWHVTGMNEVWVSLIAIFPKVHPFLVLTLMASLTQLPQKYVTSFLFLAGVLAIDGEFHFSEYMLQKHKLTDTTIDYFQRDYKNPADVKFHFNAYPKNLILIYVESLETSYQNKTLFKRDLLSALNQLELPKLSFQHFTQMPNTGWTMAGMIASQCAVPYKLSTAYVGNAVGEHLKTFMSHTDCLGDILNRYGYKNVFLNGTSLDFSGQGLFFKTHHYDELYGKKEWQQQGYTGKDLNFWGLADDHLFMEAKRSLERLMLAKRPFNLTILTVDTHGINGRLSKTCKDKGGKNFEDIVSCSSAEVANFIHYVADKGWLNRVTIVVTGDHLVMTNVISDKLNKINKHYIYNLFVSDKPLHKSRDDIVHFDLLPSILQALGFRWDDDKLGLGHSALGATNPNLDAKMRDKYLKKTILSKSEAYKKLW